MAKNTSGLPNREFLQLAHTYDWEKHDLGGRYWSDKLDGQRCWWDGGITTGMRVHDVPFANTEKTDRFVEQEYATGLWSRYGHPIRAPEWWTASLPKIPLDGELYMGRGMFEATMSVTRSHASNDWQRVKYNVFESVCLETIFEEGCINNPNFIKIINGGIKKWVIDLAREKGTMLFDQRPFASQPKILELYAAENDVIRHVVQARLSMSRQSAEDEAVEIMEEICAKGGEGIIVRNGSAYWTPKRTVNMLKVIPELNSEATVIGFTTGKDGFAGMLGAVVVKWGRHEFKLSGFKQDARTLGAGDYAVAKAYPDTRQDNIKPAGFKLGDVITFKYKELTSVGIPKSARYWRHRNDPS